MPLTPWTYAMTNNLLHISICICEQGLSGCLPEKELLGHGVCTYFVSLTKAITEASSFGGQWQKRFWQSVIQSQHCQLGCLYSAGSFLEPSHRVVWTLFLRAWPLKLAFRAPWRFYELPITINKITRVGSVVYNCKSLIYVRLGVGKLLL